MGVSAIDDMIGLIIFSLIVKASDSHMNIGTIIWRIVLAIAFIIIFFKIGKKLSTYLKKIEHWGIMNDHSKIGFTFSLMIAFFFSSVSEFIGLSTIMGAFVAGLSLERIKDRDFKIGAEYLEMIFGSIFFVSLGILVNSLFDPIKNMFLIFSLLGAAILGKVIGAYISLRSGKNLFSKKESVIIGFGLSPIGEIAALAALFALQKGILSNDIYSSIIFVSILSSIIVPVILVKLLNVVKRQKSVFKLDIKHKKSTYL